jgi:hypothetical protein
MSNATPVRTGQINGSGDVDALFLKVFAGEVLTAFEVNNVALAHTQMKTIANGKSAQFPTFGRIGAEYHTPGNEITGLPVNGNESSSPSTTLLISHSFIANIDEAKAHYDARSVYSTEMGRALATQMDKHILQMAVKTARSARSSPACRVAPRSTTVPSAAPPPRTSLPSVWTSPTRMFKAAEILDNNSVPADGRVFFCRPAQYYALIQAKDTINSLWGGAGAYSDGKIFRVAGIDIVKTINLPSTNVANGTLVLARATSTLVTSPRPLVS